MKWLVFALASVAILAVSRTSLLKPGSHGFYRFFAWEIILLMIFLKLDTWFQDAFAWYQLVSWLLLLSSQVPLILGVRSLRRKGRPGTRRRSEPHLMAFERTTVLVTTGIYRYIRHPFYASLLLLAGGVFFKLPTCYAAVLLAAAAGFLVATARADEAECLRFFGPKYGSYMKHTRRFVPFLF